jgi:hypothetical protein
LVPLSLLACEPAIAAWSLPDCALAWLLDCPEAEAFALSPELTLVSGAEA